MGEQGIKTDHLERYLEYIEKAGTPTVEQFDEDWEPIGPIVRKDMSAAGLIIIRYGCVLLANPNHRRHLPKGEGG